MEGALSKILIGQKCRRRSLIRFSSATASFPAVPIRGRLASRFEDKFGESSQRKFLKRLFTYF
jgi:hypothetical protein